MAASTLANEMPLYNGNLKHVSVHIAKENPIQKLRMESELQGHSLWLLRSAGTTDAKAKQLMTQHFSDNNIRKEGPADGGHELWGSLVAAYKDKKAFKRLYMVYEM